MKCPSGSSGGRDPWAPPPGSSGGGGGGGSSEPAKKQQRTAGSSQAGEASTTSSSSRPPPQQPPGTDGRDVPYLGEDLMFEVLRRAEARTLASAACVSRGWRALAQDERLWEAACVREWADLGFSEQQLRAVVLSMGGFRRLHAVSIRPIQRRRAGAAPAGAPGQGRGRRPQPPARLGRDQVQLSLSLFSIGFFQNMPNQPPPKKKDEGDGSDKGGGGQCG